MRRSASLLALLLLGSSLDADGYTPRPPPTPRSCRTACSGKGPGCLETCVSSFSSKPWRERLVLEEPRARPCLERERACRGKRAEGRCLVALRSCIWGALGISVEKMQRCWTAHNRAATRCQRHEGKGGWTCRNDARVSLHTCRKKAFRRPLDDDAYRVLAAIDEDLGQEVEAP